MIDSLRRDPSHLLLENSVSVSAGVRDSAQVRLRSTRPLLSLAFPAMLSLPGTNALP
jgi:hypothetical protein